MRAKIVLTKLIERMAEIGMNQIELARKSGVSRQTVCATLGRGSCSLETARKLSDALELPLKDIMEV